MTKCSGLKSLFSRTRVGSAGGDEEYLLMGLKRISLCGKKELKREIICGNSF
jgi:hypothetical protein